MTICVFLLTDSTMSVYATETEKNKDLEVFSPEEQTEYQNTTIKTGTLMLQNAGAGTGEKLSGAMFVIYGCDNKEIEEITIINGTASLSISEGNYYLKETKSAIGYYIETAHIHFTIKPNETTLVEITSEIDLDHTNPQKLIPKTGESIPIKIYILSIICFGIAMLCGLVFWHNKKIK